jgi:hypothetical protein
MYGLKNTAVTWRPDEGRTDVERNDTIVGL